MKDSAAGVSLAHFNLKQLAHGSPCLSWCSIHQRSGFGVTTVSKEQKQAGKWGVAVDVNKEDISGVSGIRKRACGNRTGQGDMFVLGRRLTGSTQPNGNIGFFLS